MPEEEKKDKPKEEEEQEEDTDEDEEKNSSDPMEMATKVAQRLESKMKEMEEKEKVIDKKIKDFGEFVKSTEIEGRTLAGKTQKTEQQKANDEASELLGETGLNPFDGEGKKALDQSTNS
ncbi:MAG: hypothetical protein U9N86_10385 [Bacteroidota bacterium]|nr:hypothetical protein [Bacteroidota bacterium]